MTPGNQSRLTLIPNPEFAPNEVTLTRLCPHRALFCSTVCETLEQLEARKRMIFRAYASKNPGVWGGPQGALRARLEKTEIANLQFLRFSYCQILRPSLTRRSFSCRRRRWPRSLIGGLRAKSDFDHQLVAIVTSLGELPEQPSSHDFGSRLAETGEAITDELPLYL